jgi:RNA polymerase sigma-70 factor (ECF subfamily)
MEKTTFITTLVNSYSDELYSWANHKVSNKESAEDIVHDTFLAAFKSFDNLKNKEQAKTWLFSILNNKIIDFYRKNGKQKIYLESEMASEKRTNSLFDIKGSWEKRATDELWETENLLDNLNFIAVLKNCASSLPERWELVITSKYALGKKSTEICKDLDISTSNYWQIIHRAKLQLKICVEKNWEN